MRGKHIVSLLCLVMLLSGCGLMPQEARLPQAPVVKEVEDAQHTMTTVMRGDVVLTQNVRCQYKPAKSESLSFSISGELVEKVYVQPGDSVEAGDLLAQLEMGGLEESLIQEQNTLERLSLDLEQLSEQKDLALRKAQVYINAATDWSSRQDANDQYARTETDYDLKIKSLEDSVLIQQKKVQEAEDKIRSRCIYTSIAGSVTYMRSFEEGAVSNEFERVVTISDIASSVFLVTGKDAALFTVGDRVTITYDKEDHEGIVVDPKSLGLEEEAEETAYISLEVPDPALEEGKNGNIILALEEAKDVLYVKSSAVKKLEDRTVVFYLDEEGMKSMKDVEIGLETGEYTEIRSGLKEGEEIIDE